MKIRYILKLILAIYSLTWFPSQTLARTVEIEIHGMTCSFCVDSLQRNLAKLNDVKRVEVSLKNKRVKLQTVSDTPNVKLFEKIILDSGFTPTRTLILDGL